MNDQPLCWLADAVARHLLIKAQTRYRKATPVQPFYGLYEGSAVSIVETIFTGLGYHTWREVKYHNDFSKRVDLWAEEPNAGRTNDYRIEGKVIWDGDDGRLNRKRFQEEKTILDDFTRLQELDPSLGKRAVVWVVFSKTGEIVNAPETLATLRLGNMIELVKAQTGARLAGLRSVNLSEHCECVNEWGFAHVVCWEIN